MSNKKQVASDAKAWDHFCETVKLKEKARELLEQQEVNSVENFYGFFEELQREATADLFNFDKDNTIATVSRGRLWSAWLWLDEHRSLIWDTQAFCKEFDSSFSKEANQLNDPRKRKREGDGGTTIVSLPKQQEALQVAQQQPQAATHEQRSRSIREAWCQKLEGVPTIDKLQAVVEAELPVPLPSPHPPAEDLPVMDVVKHTHGDTTLQPTLSLLLNAILTLRSFGTTEICFHTAIDLLILIPFELVGNETNCPFVWNKNSVDASGETVRNLRPDVLVWLPSGILAFKGENKAEPSKRDVARRELLSKLNCFSDAFFGRVPYQICYIAGGSILEFVAIDRKSGGGGGPSLHQISQVVDLKTARGRSLCVRYAVNIARVLVSLQETYPEGNVIRLGDTITTVNSTVNIMGEYAIKKTSVHSGDVLKELYAAVQTNRVPSIVSVTNVKISRHGKLTYCVAPVGFCGSSPQSITETKKAGRRLLEALQWLHDNGWVHRDIRPPNVLLSNGQWYLMDLDWANKAGQPLGDFQPCSEFLPPEISGVDNAWTPACDMWQFGKLLGCWNWNDPTAATYVEKQSSESPNDRLSAEDSLRHDFFQEV